MNMRETASVCLGHKLTHLNMLTVAFGLGERFDVGVVGGESGGDGNSHSRKFFYHEVGVSGRGYRFIELLGHCCNKNK
jgi:hypothetical protein